MLHFKHPTIQKIESSLVSQRTQPFTYQYTGASRKLDSKESGLFHGFQMDHNRICLGQGRPTFDRACEALRLWSMFPSPLTRIEPIKTPIEEGQIVAVIVRALGLWWVNCSRIVYVLDEDIPIRRYGFAYGTLPMHAECGEERFSVEWLSDDTVWYDLMAFSRPGSWMTRLGYPLARRLQKRFARESMASMQRAVNQLKIDS